MAYIAMACLVMAYVVDEIATPIASVVRVAQEHVLAVGVGGNHAVRRSEKRHDLRP